jgi:hypothetical protein
MDRQISVAVNFAFLAALMLGVVLLFVGSAFGVLTNRELAAGLFGILFIVPVVWSTLKKRASKTAQPRGPFLASAELVPERLVKIAIWTAKVWAYLLIAVLPVGILIGLTHHAILPTALGGCVSILLIASLMRTAKRLQGRLQSTDGAHNKSR